MIYFYLLLLHASVFLTTSIYKSRIVKLKGVFTDYICMIKGPLLFMVLILIVSVRCLIYDSDVAVLHLPVITRRFLSFLNYMHFVIGCILGENRQKIYFYESPVA